MVYDIYDSFAFFYNKYWTISAPFLMEKALMQVLFPAIPDEAEILDICCGTGNNAAMMNSRGYKVTGADGSKAMLAYAAKNAPNVEFIASDARDLDLGRQFDAVTCLFDSINHITNPDDLIKVFSRTYAHLKDNGVFVFDVNSEEASMSAGERDFAVADKEDAIITSAKYDRKSRITSYQLTMFMLNNGSWNRRDLTIYEKYYTEQELISMLHLSGFSSVRVLDGSEDLAIEGFEDRIFLTAWK